MPNVYLQVLEDAKKAPAQFRAMGMQPGTFASDDPSVSLHGWELCQLLYKMNEEVSEWWSNEWKVVVSDTGDLYEVHIAEESRGDGHKVFTHIRSADAAHLKMWQDNGWGFEKITGALSRIV